VNVVIWSFVEIIVPESESRRGDEEVLRTNLDINQIQQLIIELDMSGYSHVVHLASLGGWNGPHLQVSSTTMNAREYSNNWMSAWRSSIVSTIFHGIDWDFEGNDNVMSPLNYFEQTLLDSMGHISQQMKDEGYIVTIAPPQSYLNFDNSNFGQYVNITHARGWHDDFNYFGNNIYAYILYKYGEYIDLVSIQLYESYSNAAMSIYHNGVMADDYIYNFVYNIAHVNNQSFLVNFSDDLQLKLDDGSIASSSVRVPMELNKLVIGLANGWALDDSSNTLNNNSNKTVYISPMECQRAYNRLVYSVHGNLSPRGFMFWTIDSEGSNGVYMARGISDFLNTQHTSPNGEEVEGARKHK
jgi:beta-glucosidase